LSESKAGNERAKDLEKMRVVMTMNCHVRSEVTSEEDDCCLLIIYPAVIECEKHSYFHTSSAQMQDLAILWLFHHTTDPASNSGKIFSCDVMTS